MATFYDHDYWEFTADVTSAPVYVGTAVDFVRRVDGNPIPLVKPATADNDVYDDNARTTYIGVAMQAGAVGDRITCRCWAAGTMPALVETEIDLEAGSELYWDGAKFVLNDPATTEYTTTGISDNGTSELYLDVAAAGWTANEWQHHELIITSGEHADERFIVHSNTATRIVIETIDLVDWTSPITFEICNDNEAGYGRRTAVNMSKITGTPAPNAEPQICELLVLKGGRT